MENKINIKRIGYCKEASNTQTHQLQEYRELNHNDSYLSANSMDRLTIPNTTNNVTCSSTWRWCMWDLCV